MSLLVLNNYKSINYHAFIYMNKSFNAPPNNTFSAPDSQPENGTFKSNELNLRNGTSQIKSNSNTKEVKFANQSEEATDNGPLED